MTSAVDDRVFLACGACQILAYRLLERYGRRNPVWLKPAPGFTGNHVFVDGGEWVLDYHGYSGRERFLRTPTKSPHVVGRPAGVVVDLPLEALISEAKSPSLERLWLREPGQFPHEALPRARRFVERFPLPPLR